jgi:hypothetical protein
LTKPEQLAKALPPPCELLRIRWCRKKSRAKEDSQIHLSTNAEHLNADLLAPNSLLSPPSWRVAMTDFRALCQELIDEIDAKAYGIKSLPSSVAIDRARAALAQPEPKTSRLRYCDVHGQQPENAWGCPECVREMRHQLAQPEPQGPTDEELEDFALQNGGGYFNCDCQEEADILTRKHISNYRAVLTRWGRPANNTNEASQ